MSCSKKKNHWVHNYYFRDPFLKRAKFEGYRSRAIYKLKEIDEKENLLKFGTKIIDLGSSPGSWAQYILKKLGRSTKIYALDKVPMKDIFGVSFIHGDFFNSSVLDKLFSLLTYRKIELVLSDMACSISGFPEIDIPRLLELNESVLRFSIKVLKFNGIMLIKVFYGYGLNNFINKVRSYFRKVRIYKPLASRSFSREAYLLGKYFIGYNKMF
ncbi:RlmE family RNA methyltransferase [Candidatus Legionella polyplacis]|uniref:Ribosomal RNA large subunit methyltransferase E n=1 Tax=Candidatus Legionella polyplacis TaxID=2005262 RepID=A0ABZ2GX96_9GAMM